MSVSSVKWTLPDYGSAPASHVDVAPSRAVPRRIPVAAVYVLMIATTLMSLLDLLLLISVGHS